MTSNNSSQKSTHTKKPPCILSISYDAPLLHTREWILKAEGFEVTSACGFVEAEEKCRTPGFDLAIMGHSIERRDKVALIKEFKKHSQAPVLSLVRHGEGPLPEADHWVEAAEGPPALLQAVRTALEKKAGNRA
jgi:DNA-binding NtrC family response regulator